MLSWALQDVHEKVLGKGMDAGRALELGARRELEWECGCDLYVPHT